jgi:mono/diheme cytochrome c family protein
MDNRDTRLRNKDLISPVLLLLAGVLSIAAAAFPVMIHAAPPGMGGSAARAQAATPSPAGDVERGRQLFMGEAHLQNGSPPCMGCHNIGSYGRLGGGALGPDLTDVSSLYSDADLAQALASIPWKTMNPIFSAHPLSTQEQADLRVFLEASAGQPKADREALLFGLSLAGLIAAAGVFGFLYRGRLRGVRDPLVKGAQHDDQGK